MMVCDQLLHNCIEYFPQFTQVKRVTKVTLVHLVFKGLKDKKEIQVSREDTARLAILDSREKLALMVDQVNGKGIYD